MDFHPAVDATMRYLTTPVSLEQLAREQGITRQAVSKQVKAVKKYLSEYGQVPAGESPETEKISHLEAKVSELTKLVAHLRRRLILCATTCFILTCFKNLVQKSFPKFDVRRFSPLEKRHILDMAEKFTRAGGTLKDFCKHIKKSPDTVTDWLKRYEKYGMAGLADKKTRPRSFSNKIPTWIRGQLFILFTRFPQWKSWQYYKYLRNNPATQYCVSVDAIDKLKRMHTKLRDEEVARIKKRWCFEPGTPVWNIDFTTIIKTARYHLRLLTVSDHNSRFLFDFGLYTDVTTAQMIDHLEGLFIKYGKPDIIKADNGPEMRMTCREMLKDLAVHLLNSPHYYGQFMGAHERLHRTLKGNISNFETHGDLFRLMHELETARDDLNYHLPLECLGNKTPAEVYLHGGEFTPMEGTQVVKPYVKDGELRMKFTGRSGRPARLPIPHIADQPSTT